MLGRTPDAAGLASWEDKLAQGETLTEVRSDMAHSTEAASDVTTFYGDTLGVGPSAADLANCEGALAAGQSLAAQQAFLRPSFAQSQTAANAIQGMFQGELGRPATQADIACWEGQLQQGHSLPEIQQALATAPEAQAKAIQGAYQQIFGRAPSADELASAKAAMQGGQSANSAVAHSDAAKAAINVFYQQLFGTDADPTALKSCQDALAAGQSLKDQQAFLRPQFAQSKAEEGALNGVYDQALGREIDPSGLANYEGEIAAGKSLNDVRGELSTSQEAQGKINDLAHQVLGRDATSGDLAKAEFKQGRGSSAGELADAESMLASGKSWGDVRGMLTGTQDARDDVANLYWLTQGKTASKDQIDAGVSALASGTSLDQMQHDMAYSKDAQDYINANSTKIAGRSANPDEMAAAQQLLATMRIGKGNTLFTMTVNGIQLTGTDTGKGLALSGHDPSSGGSFSVNMGAWQETTPENPGFESTASSLGKAAVAVAESALAALATASKDKASVPSAISNFGDALSKSEAVNKALRDLGRLAIIGTPYMDEGSMVTQQQMRDAQAIATGGVAYGPSPASSANDAAGGGMLGHA